MLRAHYILTHYFIILHTLTYAHFLLSAFDRTQCIHCPHTNLLVRKTSTLQESLTFIDVTVAANNNTAFYI